MSSIKKAKDLLNNDTLAHHRLQQSLLWFFSKNDKCFGSFAGPSYSNFLPSRIILHCLSISYKSNVAVSGIVTKVIKHAINEAYPLNRNNCFSPIKLKRTDARSAPSFPEEAEMPWHIVLVSVGKISAGIKNVVQFGPHWIRGVRLTTVLDGSSKQRRIG